MNVFRWTAGAFLILAMAALLAAAQGGQELDITGYYNEKDGEFTRITRNGDLYQFLQRYKVGDWAGVAIRQDDRLSVAWQRSDGANLGVTVFKIEKGDKGPTLVGGWAALQDRRITPDTQRWSRKLE